MKKYSAPDFVKIDISATESFAADYKNCTKTVGWYWNDGEVWDGYTCGDDINWVDDAQMVNCWVGSMS